MPNNRITFNGNVGYRNDKMNPTNFIGDFDFEYKLIQSGKLSLKAYTHTNDYKEFKTGLPHKVSVLFTKKTLVHSKSCLPTGNKALRQKHRKKKQP